MRSSKSILAGLAAGALGAGLLAVGLAAPANATAGVASSFSLTYPSYTIVTDGWSTANAFVAPYSVVDSDGTALAGSLGANRELRVAITNPAAVGSGTTVLAPSAATITNASTALTFAPTGSFTSWASVGTNAAGNYTMAVALVNTANGAILQATSVPIQVVQAAGAPTPNVSFINSVPNVINSLGAGVSASAANQSIYLTNSTGGPYSALFTRAADDTLLGLAANTRDDSLTYTFPATSTASAVAAAPGRFTALPGGTTGAWNSAAGRNFINTTVWVNNAPVSTGSLPVAVGSLTGLATAELTTTPSYEASAGVYQVPPGTTALSFGIEYSSATAGTLPWNITSNTAAGVSTLSGGTAAISAAGLGVINVNLNAAAAASGKSVTLSTGGSTVTVNFTAPAPLIDAITPLAKVSTATEIPGTITDQYGDALSGTWTVSLQPSGGTCFTTSTQISSATANAAGEFGLAVPASVAPSAAQTVSFLVCATNGVTTVTNGSASVTYTASGGVSSIDLVPSVANIPVIATPASGIVATATDTTNSVTSAASANVNAAGTTSVFRVTVQTSPVVAVTLSVPEGAYLTTSSNTSLAWNAGKRAVVVPGDGTTSVVVYATKPGAYDVTATVGSSTDAEKFVAGVQTSAARQINVKDATITMPRLDVRTLTATATDIYGNAVPGAPVTVAGAGAVTASAASAAGTDGVVSTFVTSGEAVGKGLVTFTLSNPVTSAITGSPAEKATDSTEVTVSSGTGEKTILIVGERATVSGKPGIRIEGDTTGFDRGSKMVPYVRFPGQSEYTAGTARPETSAAGDFSWQRKTGKKTYVFFTNEAGDVKSNRVIIAAN